MARIPPSSRRVRTSIEGATLSLEKTGVRRFDLRDPYHLAVTLSWPAFLLLLVGSWLLINLLFGLLYYARPGSIANAAPGSLFDAFFFSVETLATVGYGAMSPSTPYGHVVSAVEIFTGMILTAVMTGLVFVRFAKPRPKILYPDVVVVTPHNSIPTLMIRIGNGRVSPLLSASARLTALILESNGEQQFLRRAYDLPLSRREFPLFALTWTVMHAITNDSPLAGLDRDALSARGIRLLLSVSARDPAVGADVHDVHSWSADSILFGMRYSDAVRLDGESRTVADMAKISSVEPDSQTRTPAAG